MAEPTEKQFSALIAEQKATTQALMSVEERAAADAAVNEKNQNRIAGGIQAAKTRAANSAEKSADDDDKSQSLLENIAGGITDISSGSKGSASSEKEKKNEELAAEKKRTGLLGKIASGIGGMRDFKMKPIKAAGKGIMAMLKSTLLAGALLALVAFLDSKYWKDIKKWLVEKAPGMVETISNVIGKMVGLFTGETWTKAWEKLKDGDIGGAFSDVAIGVAALAATLATGALLLAPLGTIGLASKAIRGTYGLMKKGGRALIPGKAAKVLPGKAAKVLPKVAKVGRGPDGRFISLKSTANSTGRGLLSGAGKFARLLGPVGLAVSAGVAIYSGITEGMEAYKKTGKLAEGFKTGAAAALKTLTLGLVSTKTFKKGFDYIEKHVEQLFNLSVEVDPKEWAALEKNIKEGKKDIGSLSSKRDVVIAANKKALSATIVNQGLVDANIIKISEISVKMLEATKEVKKNMKKQLLMDRAAENNALIAANKAVATNDKAVRRLKEEERKFKAAVTMYGKDTEDGKIAAAKLDATRVKLRTTRTAGQKLRDDVEKAEAVLLKEDRRLIKKAKDEGVKANWRSRLNVFTSEFPAMMEEKMKPLTEWFSKTAKAAKGVVIKIKGKVLDVAAWFGEMATNIWGSIKTFFWDDKGTGFFQKIGKIKMPTGADILAILPDWMTDPVGALKSLIKTLTKYLPSWLGGPKSKKELKAEAARIKDVANKRKMRESLSDAVASKEITKELRTQIMAYRSTRKLFDKKYGGGDQEAFIKFLQDAGKRGFNQRAGFAMTDDIPAAKIKELRILDEKFKKAALDGNSLFTHDTGLHDRLDRIFPPTKNAERNNTMTESALQKSVGSQNAVGPTIIDSSQKVVNANKTGVQNFNTPLKNTNLAGALAAA